MVSKPDMRIRMMHRNKEFSVEEVGVFRPEAIKINELSCGEVGYMTCNIHNPQEVKVGDTITAAENPAPKPLPGYRSEAFSFLRVYPVNAADFMNLREAIENCD